MFVDMSFHMLVSDIDGTLIGPDGVISPNNRRALAQLQARGIPVVLATGRTWGGTREIWEDLRLTDPVILCNGAQVYDPDQGRMLWDHRLTWREVQAAEALLRDRPVHVYAVMSEVRVLVQRPREPGATYPVFSGDRYVEVDDVFSTLTRTGITPIKLFVLADPSAVEPLVKALREKGGLNAVQSESFAFDVVPADVSKASALRVLLDRLNLSPRQVVAVGNAPNDLDMLRFVGLGVAVGDAHPDVLVAADHVTTPCAEDAVAQVVHSAFFLPVRDLRRPTA